MHMKVNIFHNMLKYLDTEFFKVNRYIKDIINMQQTVHIWSEQLIHFDIYKH